MTRLVVGYPAALPESPDGSVVIDEKLRSGVSRYQELWPGGNVVLAAPRAPAEGKGGLGTRLRSRDELGFDLVLAPTWAQALDQAAGDLHLLPLLHRTSEVEHLLERSVLTVEFTPEDLARTEHRGASGALANARITVGSARRRRTFESWVRRARGIQCNGYPAYDRFAALSPSALLFFDTRLTSDHIRLAQEQQRDAPSTTFRLGFSGRLIDAKGPQHAIAAIERLRANGVECTLDLIGTGPLEQELRRTAGPTVRFKEGMDFATGWTTYAREELDLMLLPHTQGDPSGTYLEAAGCGVPVVGFDNVALDALVQRHGIGVTAPLDDNAALARTVSAVLADGEQWATLRSNGLKFMAAHCFEVESQRRVEHLASLAS